MNRRTFLMVTAATGAVGLAGCLGDDPGDPADTLEEYLEAVIDGDEEGALELIHIGGQRSEADDIDRMEGGTIEEIVEDDLRPILEDRLGFTTEEADAEIQQAESLVDDAEAQPQADIDDEATLYFRVSVDGDDVEDYAYMVVSNNIWWLL